MAIVEINGHQVELDDSFLSLPEKEQHAQIDEIAKTIPTASKATPDESAVAGAIGGAALGAPVSGVVGAKNAIDYLKAPAEQAASVQVSAAPAEYASAHGVGQGAVANAEHNVGQIIKNKVAQEALNAPGYVSPGNSRLLMPEQVARQIAQENLAPAAKQLSGAEKIKDLAMSAGKALAPSSKTLAGKVLNTLAPVGALAGAGAEGVDAYNRAKHGDYGRAAISGLGALGSAASMIPTPMTRGIGTAAAVGAPLINAIIDKTYGREGYADGGDVKSVFGSYDNSKVPQFTPAVADTWGKDNDPDIQQAIQMGQARLQKEYPQQQYLNTVTRALSNPYDSIVNLKNHQPIWRDEGYESSSYNRLNTDIIPDEYLKIKNKKRGYADGGMVEMLMNDKKPAKKSVKVSGSHEDAIKKIISKK